MCPNKYQPCFAQACCNLLIIFAFLISRSILDFQFFSNQFVFSNPILTNPVKCCSKNETPWQHFPKTFGPTHGQGRLWSHHNSRPPFQGKPRIFRLRCRQPQSLALSHPVHPRMRKLNNFRLCFAIYRNLTRLNFIFSFARAFVVLTMTGKMRERGSIVCKLMANLMSMAGFNQIITVDLWQKEIQGFFDCPVDNLRAHPFLLKYIQHCVSKSSDAASEWFWTF